MFDLKHVPRDPTEAVEYEGYNGHGVLTYAILEALHQPKGAGADPVSVFGIATHISREVPAISQKCRQRSCVTSIAGPHGAAQRWR
jgi:hypothetical protein